MIANECNMAVDDFVWTGGDCHIYSNHHTQVTEQLSRIPKALPTLRLKVPVGTSVFDIKYEDIEVLNYDPHSAIKAPVAV